MSLLAQARNCGTNRRGRHAIERARSAATASRRRHAQLILPRGVRRTRMSETRTARGAAPVRQSRTAPRSPFRSIERIKAVRLAASTG
jgi:hypothetical protein